MMIQQVKLKIGEVIMLNTGEWWSRELLDTIKKGSCGYLLGLFMLWWLVAFFFIRKE